MRLINNGCDVSYDDSDDCTKDRRRRQLTTSDSDNLRGVIPIL
jgi:hypothetical protein